MASLLVEVLGIPVS